MPEERRLRIPGLKDRIPAACDFVMHAARSAGLDERAVHHCQLAVDEAVTNIIEHGYRGDGLNQSIEIICRAERDRFVIVVVDDGPPFDPLWQSDPDPLASMEDREPGGWGIYFIKKVMDEVVYTDEAGRNSLMMVKHVQDAPRLENLRDHVALKVSVSNPVDDIWLFAPHGRLDARLCPGLDRLMTDKLEAGKCLLVLDLGDVEYVSSMGLKTMVSLWQRARECQGNLVLAAVQTRVHEVLQIIGLDLVFQIFPTPNEAAAALDNPPA
ncbi:MAG: anti-sigma factor antagonist [Chloroflexota bacterium]